MCVLYFESNTVFLRECIVLSYVYAEVITPLLPFNHFLNTNLIPEIHVSNPFFQI